MHPLLVSLWLFDYAYFHAGNRNAYANVEGEDVEKENLEQNFETTFEDDSAYEAEAAEEEA